MAEEETNLRDIADILEMTMANAGIMDDYDEIIADIFEHGTPAEAITYHNQVMGGLRFINKHLKQNNPLDVARWQREFDELVEGSNGE